MVSLTALWLPIAVSAVIVFVASSILHMVIGHHRNDYKKLPNEEGLLESLRKEGLQPGYYVFPRCANSKEMSSPEMIEKYKRGPVGTITVVRSGPPNMGKYLSGWFVYCVVVGVFVAYLAGRVMGAGAGYLDVFRVAGTTAFLGYGLGHAIDSIWKGTPWIISIKHILDGLIYGLLTAGTFGWLWP